MHTPIIEVSHLPSSASFYAAVIQPLGLQYLSSSPTAGGPACLHFGLVSDIGTEIVFSLVSRPAPRRSYIYLTAPSPKSVTDFHKTCLLAHHQTDNTIEINSAESIARTRDFDGNMLEAVYSSRGGRRVPTIHTAATENEARRVLEWQHNVAKSISAQSDARSEVSGTSHRSHQPLPVTYRRAESYPPPSERPMRLVRRETITTEHYRREDERARAASGGGGISGKAVIGTLLGAAAGAAVAYAMVRSESPQRMAPPPMGRRASYGDRGSGSSYTHVPLERVVERVPARSYISARDDGERPRYAERYTLPAPPSSRVHDLGRIEERSHVSHRSDRSGRGSRERSRSEVGSRYERPLTILPPRARSPPASSHVSRRSHKSHHSSDTRTSPSRHGKAESYISSRSHRTESTLKGQPVATVQYIPASPSSRTSTTTIRVVPKDEERRSMISARHVPLPRSMVSGMGYASSVAPSDSVSSVGSKRERERLRERMRPSERW